MAARAISKSDSSTVPPSIGVLAAAWLHDDSHARLLVDSDRRVLWRNPACERLLLDCPDIDTRNGQLSAGDRNHQATLAAFLVETGADTRTLTIPCEDGDGHILFEARRLGSVSADVIALCLRRTGSAHEVIYADFGPAFGFTPTETQIVGLLIGGVGAEDIAARNGGSVATVRTHIRSVYAKMDVSNREAMFFRLRPFRIA